MTAPEFAQADDRADRDRDEADLGGARGRRAVLPRRDHGDLGRRAARRRVHGQRDGLSRRSSWPARRGCASCRRTRWRCATPTLPPVLSGLPVDDRSQWAGLPRGVPPPARGAAGRAQRLPGLGRRGALPARRVQHELARGATSTCSPRRPTTPRAMPLDATWHRLNSTVRTSEAAFDVDEHVPGDGKVVYLSLGSLGCMDVGADAAADRRDGRRPSTARSCRWGR